MNLQVVARMIEAWRRRNETPQNAAQRLTESYFDLANGPGGRDYKAPHAYRGTPPRPKTPRHLRARKRLFRAA